MRFHSRPYPTLRLRATCLLRTWGGALFADFVAHIPAVAIPELSSYSEETAEQQTQSNSLDNQEIGENRSK